jgi:hypothetical protein
MPNLQESIEILANNPLFVKAFMKQALLFIDPVEVIGWIPSQTIDKQARNALYGKLHQATNEETNEVDYDPNAVYCNADAIRRLFEKIKESVRP